MPQDDGWLLTLAIDGGKPVMCVVDANTMKEACVLAVPHANLMGLHGRWVPT